MQPSLVLSFLLSYHLYSFSIRFNTPLYPYFPLVPVAKPWFDKLDFDNVDLNLTFHPQDIDECSQNSISGITII
jgi:hypothetical protein